MSESNGDKLVGEAVRLKEQSVLGSCMRDNAVIGDIVQILRDDDFYHDAHQTIYRAILALFDDGKPVDAVMLAEVLKEHEQIENIGGYAYLGKLWDVAPTAANAEFYAKAVRESSILRRLHVAGQKIAYDAGDPAGPAEDILESAEREIFAIAQMGLSGETVKVSRAVQEAYDRMDDRLAGKSGGGVVTGFLDLDAKITHLANGEFVIVAARPSTGKTALGIALAINAAQDGHSVFVASLEQTRVELAERMMCSIGGVNYGSLRKGLLSSEDISKLHGAGSALSKLEMHIDDTANQGVLRIAANARRLRLRHGIGLVIVDYLQLIEPENRRDPRHEQVSEIARRLKLLARDIAVPVVTMAQLNRKPEDRADQRPRSSDLRESGGLEAHADTIMLLHRQGDTDVIDVIVDKQRNGPTGEVSLFFRKQFQRFENYAPVAADFSR